MGSFANCGIDITAWGIVHSAEENFQSQAPEPAYADGRAAAPSQRPFICREGKLSGLGNVYELAGNTVGWMVKVDPIPPDQPVVKHTGGAPLSGVTQVNL